MTIAYDKHHDWLFVGASVGGSATFGTQTYVGGSTKNALLAKYDPANGACLQVVGASDWGNSEPSDIAVRGNTVAFCGYIAGQVAFGDHTLNSGGMRDALFATFSADSMICQWASAGGGPGADYASGVAFLPNGDLYFVGVVDSGGTFDGLYLSSTTGAYDFFIARYYGSGGIQWISKSQSSDRADSVRAPGDPPMYIATDDLGNAFVTGSFGDVSQLGPFSIASNGLEDVFLAKIAPNDSVCWVKSYGGAKQDRAYAIDFTSQREILFAGYFNQEADYGIHHLIAADTLADGFVARAKEPHGLFITRPRKNGLMVIGEEYAISWNSKNVGLISIEYTATGQTGWTQVAPVVNAQDGHFLWTVPAVTPTANAAIRITDLITTESHTVSPVAIAPMKTWTGAEDARWRNPNNWNPVSPPMDLDVVRIPQTANDPVADSVLNFHVAGLGVESLAKFTLGAQAESFTVRGYVINEGTVEILGSPEIFVGADVINRPQSPLDRGFIAGQSTVVMTDSGGARGKFHNLRLDSAARARSDGNIRVAGRLSILRAQMELQQTDTLTIESDDTTAIFGDGYILSGTILRALNPAARTKYRFESPYTYIQYPNGGAPSSYAMTMYLDVDPDSAAGAGFQAYPAESGAKLAVADSDWVLVEDAALDTANRTFVIYNAEENGTWTFGFLEGVAPAPGKGKPRPDEITAGRMMRRVYRGTSGRNAPKESDSTSGATLSFRWDPDDMTPADPPIEEDWSLLKCFALAPVTQAEEETQTPVAFRLEQNYPNPFNPTTTIEFQLPEAGKTNLVVYDVLGQVVARLLDEPLEAGNYQVEFDARNIASGVYFYRIEAVGASGATYRDVKKMALLK